MVFKVAVNIPTNNAPHLTPGQVLFERQEWGDDVQWANNVCGRLDPAIQAFVKLSSAFHDHLFDGIMRSRVLVGESLVQTTIGEMLQYFVMWLLILSYMKPPNYF